MEEITNSMNAMTISTVESTVIVPKVVKKRIFKKKEVPTVEPVVEDNISSGNTVVLLPTQNDAEQPLVAVSSEDNDDCSSVGDKSVVSSNASSKGKKVAKKRTKKTEVVASEEQTVDATEPPIVKKAPKKTKKVVESQQVIEPVVESVIESVIVAVEPTKEKAVRKTSKKTTKKVEESLQVVEPVVESAAPVAVEVPIVKKTAKKTTKKVEEGDATEPSSKSKKITVNKNEEKIKLSEIKPKSIPQFFAILAAYIRQNTHYVGLRENTDGLIVPVFFVITGPYDKEAKKFPCQFFKESVTTDEEGDITVKPLWEEVWQTGFITQSQCLNMLPFDETQHYFYTPKTVEEQKASLYNM